VTFSHRIDEFDQMELVQNVLPVAVSQSNSRVEYDTGEFHSENCLDSGETSTTTTFLNPNDSSIGLTPSPEPTITPSPSQYETTTQQQPDMQPTPRTLTRRQQEKLAAKRANVLQELLETERHYCERLDLACALFLRTVDKEKTNLSHHSHPSANNNDADTTTTTTTAMSLLPTALATSPHQLIYARLFSSIEDILALHQSLCQALESEMAGNVTENTQVGHALRYVSLSFFFSFFFLFVFRI
jgi:hypothetical protein